MLVQCLPNVYDAGPTLYQHWLNVLHLQGCGGGGSCAPTSWHSCRISAVDFPLLQCSASHCVERSVGIAAGIDALRLGDHCLGDIRTQHTPCQRRSSRRRRMARRPGSPTRPWRTLSWMSQISSTGSRHFRRKWCLQRRKPVKVSRGCGEACNAGGQPRLLHQGRLQTQLILDCLPC